MNTFLKRTLLFLTVPCVIFVLLLGSLNWLNKKKDVKKKLGSKTCLFIGDSHIQQAIDDTMLHAAINVAQNSESLYFSYFKLKTILQANPSIKDVYLGFSYHTISSYYDQFIDGEFSNAISGRYFYLLPMGEQCNLIKANSNGLPSYFKVVIKNGVTNLASHHSTYLGKFDNVFVQTNAKEQSMDKRILFQYYTNNKLNNFAETNILYLNKIVELCKDANVSLVLLNAPLHKYYKEKIPAEFIDKYNQIVKSIKVPMLDLSSLPLRDSCFIPDGDHVSQVGAIETTRFIAGKMK